MQLVKYQCGCVGVAPGADDRALLFKVCDEPDRDIVVTIRLMETTNPDGKPVFRGLSDAETDYFVHRLRRLTRLGHLFEDVQRKLHLFANELDDLADM